MSHIASPIIIEAIRPEEVAAAKAATFPWYVLQAFNHIIAAKFVSKNQSVTIYQDDVIEDMILLAQSSGLELDRSIIFDKGYLNVEEVYRAAGWKVDYDKPAYNESYRAHFKFKAV